MTDVRSLREVAEPFPLTPVPEVLARRERDLEVFDNRWRPAIYDYGHFPTYEITQVVSYPEWAVPCPYHTCKAEVGEPCRNKRSRGFHRRGTTLHEARKKAYRKAFRPGPVETPLWRWKIGARVEQRRLVYALQSAAYNQSLANRHLERIKGEARDLKIDEAMITRAVKYGHTRARRERLKARARGWYR